MTLAFLGTPASAVPTLDALIDAGHDVRLVVTQPDRASGRSRTPQPPPVKRRALEHGLAVFQPRKVKNRAFVDRLAESGAELLIVVAYGRILTRATLEIARLGSVNLHFSLLPAYRGAAPVQWALAAGETVTGVTVMQMTEGLDEGPILLQRGLPVEPGEHAPSLTRRLADVGAGLMVEAVAGLAEDRIVAEPQDDRRATFAPLLTVADGVVDWGRAAAEIEGRIRGFDPWPGAWTHAAGRRLRLLAGRACDPVPGGTAPGTVLEPADDELPVACGDGGRLCLSRLQFEGRPPVTARDALNGRQLRPGDRLGPPSD